MLEAEIEETVSLIRRRQLCGSRMCASAIYLMLRKILSKLSFDRYDVIITTVKKLKERMVDANKSELAIGNACMRTLFFIREAYENNARKMRLESKIAEIGTHQHHSSAFQEYDADLSDNGYEAGMDTPDRNSRDLSPLSFPSPPNGKKLRRSKTLSAMFQEDILDYANIDASEVKNNVLSEINEILDELEAVHRIIAEQSLDHIFSREVVLTYSNSVTVEHFLASSHRHRNDMEVFVVASRDNDSLRLASSLSQEHGIHTTIIPETAVFAMMPRITKVVMGAEAVLATGELVCLSGGLLIAQAAKYHRVPLIVVTGVYKLTPLFAADAETVNEFGSPTDIITFGEDRPNVDVYSPHRDLVPASDISLYVTNAGELTPSYVYHLIQEYYHADDYSFS